VRLAGVSIVRNEADIVEAFVRTNLVLLDTMHVAVHRSIDGTREILAALAREGLPLKLYEIPEEAFNQELRTSWLVRQVFASDAADFVFPLDGDEFVRAPDRARLEAELATLPDGAAGAMQWLTYVPTAADPRVEHPLMRIEHRVRMSPLTELNLDYCKATIGRWFAAREDARLLEGNHAVMVGEEVAAMPLGQVAVAHYPVRSPEQLARKAAIGWLAQLAKHPEFESTGIASHWRRIFERLKAGETLRDEDVRAFVNSYIPPASQGNELVRDPLPHRVATERHAALRHTPTLVQGLLEAAERFARLQAGR
jgi:hypothetical protein